MHMSFGNLAGDLGQAISGLVGGIQRQRQQQQQNAVQQALLQQGNQRIGIEQQNADAMNALRATESQRYQDLLDMQRHQQDVQNQRAATSSAGLIPQINSMRKRLGYTEMLDPAQAATYDPAALEHEYTGLTQQLDTKERADEYLSVRRQTAATNAIYHQYNSLVQQMKNIEQEAAGKFGLGSVDDLQFKDPAAYALYNRAAARLQALQDQHPEVFGVMEDPNAGGKTPPGTRTSMRGTPETDQPGGADAVKPQRPPMQGTSTDFSKFGKGSLPSVSGSATTHPSDALRGAAFPDLRGGGVSSGDDMNPRPGENMIEYANRAAPVIGAAAARQRWAEHTSTP